MSVLSLYINKASIIKKFILNFPKISVREPAMANRHISGTSQSSLSDKAAPLWLSALSECR